MHVLLRIEHAALRAAAPNVTWHTESSIPASLAQEIEVAVVANPPPGSLIGYPNLKFVQSLWAGVDRLLDDSTIPPNLVIARMVDPALAIAMGETALWATLSLHRRFFHYSQQQTQSQWRHLPQVCAHTVRVTVLGMGEMGRAVANRLVSQGYQVRGWRLGVNNKAKLDDSSIQVELGKESLLPLLAQTDIVINLLPLTTQTRNIINHDFLYSLPPGASIVNLARGGHLVEADLLHALNNDQISHAILDL